MKNSILLLAMMFLLHSCSKNDDDETPNYNDFLSDKAVISILAVDAQIWSVASKVCTDCDVPLEQSSIPYNHFITWTDERNYEYRKTSLVFPYLKIDRNNDIVSFEYPDFNRLDKSSKKETICSVDSMVNEFEFDKNNNIYATTLKGVRLWNVNKWQKLDFGNQDLNNAAFLNIAIDGNNTKWIELQSDSRKIIKIDDSSFEIIDLGGIFDKYKNTTNFYLYDMKTDNANCLWVCVSDDSYASNLIRFENGNPVIVSPESENDKIIVNQMNTDSKGNMILIYYFKDSPSTRKIAIFRNNKFTKIDNPFDTNLISVTAHGDTLYCGTISGIEKKYF